MADPLAAADSLTAVVEAHPLAAASLAAVLQQTAILPVWEGLVAESTTYSTLLAGPEFGAWLEASPAAQATSRRSDEPVLVSRVDDILTSDPQPPRAP